MWHLKMEVLQQRAINTCRQFQTHISHIMHICPSHTVKQFKKNTYRHMSNINKYLSSFPTMFSSLDSMYTSTQKIVNLCNTSGTLSDYCVLSLPLPFRISTVAIQGVCRRTNWNRGCSQQWSLVLSSPQSPSTLR